MMVWMKLLAKLQVPIGVFCTFSLVAQLMVVLPQLGDELRPLQLDLRVGGQVIGRGSLSDHSIGLNIQIPVDPEPKTTLGSVNPAGTKIKSGHDFSTYTAGL